MDSADVFKAQNAELHALVQPGCTKLLIAPVAFY
jgi:hypothetical protein